LRTGFLGPAKKKAGLLAGLFWNLFDHIRELRRNNMSLSPDEVTEFMERCKIFIEWQVTQLWENVKHPIDAAGLYGEISGDIARTKLELVSGNSKNISYFLDTMGDDCLKKIDRDSSQWAQINTALMQYFIQLLEHEKASVKNKFPELNIDQLYGSPQENRSANDAQGTKGGKASTLISQVVPLFISEYSIKWKPKVESEILASLNLFIECVGDVPIQSITRSDMASYKNILKKLPPNKNKSPC
jgi:hypothetical protein